MQGNRIRYVPGMIKDLWKTIALRILADDRDLATSWFKEEMSSDVKADEATASDDQDRAQMIRRYH